MSTPPTCVPLLFSLVILGLFSSIAGQAQGQCNAADKKTLLSFAANFVNSSFLANSWIPSTDCCSWSGVGCNVAGRVTDVNLIKDQYLSGTISQAIGDLPELLNLRLSTLPNLVGNIPPSISKLQKLVWLQLDHNSLSGPIPPVLSDLSSVTFFSLSNNHLTGSIPPSLVKLGNTVGALVLSHNKLTGQIPDSFGSFPKEPGTLFLSHNYLSGPIPKSLGEPDWPFIDLSHNRLTGDASFLFGSRKATTIMSLQQNRLSFDLSKVTFPPNLTTLELNNNMIYGSIPAQINEVTGYGLTKFNVSYNMLCGEIPQGAVTTKFNYYSYFNNRCLCGPPLSPCK